MKKTNIIKLFGAIAAILYTVWYLQQPYQSTIIDAADILIHEAGHVIFAPFGEFMHVLGGSLNQVLMPLVFIGYFWLKQKDKYSASLLLFWLGLNIVNVSVYVGDAVAMQFPLLGGDNSTHDWNWLLIYTGQLHHTAAIAYGIKLAGMLILGLAAFLSVRYSLQPEPMPLEEVKPI